MHSSSLVPASSRSPGLLLVLLLAAGGCGDDTPAGNTNANQNGNTPGDVCGDGDVTGPEECDDGPANSDVAPDACRTDCRRARCGDGAIDTGEACDDGAFNADVPNACRSACVLPACGDGLVDTDAEETCDDGNRVAGDGCSPDCRVEYCGNGVVDEALGEICDDGNFVAGDGCSPDCRVPCGNGLRDHPDERCDGAPPDGESCVGFGWDHGGLGCSNLCQPDFGGCALLGWRQTPSDFVDRLDAVFADASGFAVAVGSGGSIETFDGMAWHLGPGLVTVRLNGVWGSAPDDVWAVGEAGTLIRFDGQSWTLDPAPPAPGNLTAVSGRGANDVWIAADDGLFLHFDGVSWTEHPTAAQRRWGLAVLAADDAWAVGVGTEAWHWDGVTWSPVPLPWHVTLHGLYASGPTDVWAVGGNGNVLHHDGQAWRNETGLPAITYYGVSGTGPDDVWIVGGESPPRVFHFDGRGWAEHAVPLGQYTLRDVHATGRAEAWAVGTSGRAVRFHGGGWHEQLAPAEVSTFTTVPEGDVFAQLGVAPAVSLGHLDGGVWADHGALTQAGELWASGPADVWNLATPTLARWDGASWTSSLLPESPWVWHLAGHTPGRLWAAGLGDEMLELDGLAVTPVVFDAEPHWITALWVDDLDRPWAAGYRYGSEPQEHVLLRHDGVAWVKTAAPVSRAIQGIWGAAPDDVWAVGAAGALLHFDGVDWTAQPAPVSGDLHAVHGHGPDDVWAAGEWGQLIRYDGVSWSPVRGPTVAPLLQVRASARFVWVRDGDGRLWRLLRNVPWTCEAAERCDDGIDNDCDGRVDARDPACTGCADGSAEQVFARGMVGCAGQVSFAERDTLCGAGHRPCTAEEWVRRHGRAGPTHHYWTDDDLRWTGPVETCWVSTTIGSASCSPAQPMRVCAGTPDPLGNTCGWTGCGLGAPDPLDYFGGCASDPTAGTLCCPE
jgi:cysteine-rich repeat protein